MSGQKIREGLLYIPEIISKDIEKQIFQYLNSEDLNWKHVSLDEKSRRTLDLGFTYDYHDNYSSPAVNPIPPVLQNLISEHQCVIGDVKFNQCSINEYIGSLGQGINWHSEHPLTFGSTVACYTIGSGFMTEFRSKDFNKLCDMVNLKIKPRSVYVMSREFTNNWNRRISRRKSDPTPDPNSRSHEWIVPHCHGPRTKRGDQYSITFRYIPDIPGLEEIPGPDDTDESVSE